jgi:uncharacterized protein (TIGR03437 family)
MPPHRATIVRTHNPIRVELPVNLTEENQLFFHKKALILLFLSAALATPQTPILHVLSFEVNEGGDIPLPWLVSVTNAAIVVSCTARTADLAVDSKPGPAWLSVTPASGLTPLFLNVSVDPAGLGPGKYTGAVMHTCTLGSQSATSKDEVDLVIDAVAPDLTVLPSPLSFKGLSAGPPGVQPLLVVNRGGGGALDFTAAVTTDSSWLKIASGSSQTDSVLLTTVDFPSLPPGVFRGNIAVSSSTGDPSSVDVNVLALPSGPALGVSHAGLVFRLSAGAGTTDSDVVKILNQGDSAMPWTADILIGSKFLSVTPATGTTLPGGATPLTIAPTTSATPNTSDLAAGDYYGLVRLSAAGAANSPQYVLAVLHVLGTQSPTLRPGGLVIETTGAAATGKLNVIGSSADKYNFAVTTSSPDALNWLSATPASGAVTTSTPSAITVTANPAAAGLKPGFYVGEVDIAITPSVLPAGFPPGGVLPPTTSAVAVLLVVLPTGAKLASERSATTGCTPSKLGIAQTAQPGGFSTNAAWPTPLAFLVLDDCANPVTTAQVAVTFSNGDPPLLGTLSDPSIGQYTATWVPRNAMPTAVTAKASAGALTPAQVRSSGSVGNSLAPLVNRNGTVHLLYPQPGAPLAPGTLIQINGTKLATTDAAPTDVPLPTTVNGTSVLIGAYSAPLIALSDGTLAAQLPVELAPNNQYPVVVSVNNAISVPDTITVAATTPGIQATADGYAAQHPDGSAVTPAAPAAPGELVSIFLSGLGATDPVVASGVQAPATEPLARITSAATVTLNGNPMSVGYAGLAPRQVGLYRIDLTVPLDAAPGDLKLSVSQNGLSSNTVLLTVGPGK